MEKCSYCGSTIIIGGVRSGIHRYCNNKCAGNGYVLQVSKGIPPDVVERQMEQVFRGNCPRCGEMGPVDVHKIYDVWSAMVLTRWTTRSQLSCRSCATKSQIWAAIFSSLFGWWGFPWGLILTPIQVTRNIIAIFTGRDGSEPSENLRRLVLVNLGAQAMQQNRQKPPVLPAMAR